MSRHSNKVTQILSSMDDEIVNIVSQFVKRRRGEYEKAARDLKTGVETDIVRYSEMLAEQTITKEDYEFLLRGRYAQMKIELLEQVSLSKSRFDDITEQLLRFTLKTAFSLLLPI
jgi:hypothetical protein